MFTKTKHDLCGSCATIDYEVLLRLVKANLYSSTIKMEEELHRIQSGIVDNKEETHFSLISEKVEDLAYWLQIGAETVEVLQGMRTRQNLKWTNFPKKEAK